MHSIALKLRPLLLRHTPHGIADWFWYISQPVEIICFPLKAVNQSYIYSAYTVINVSHGHELQNYTASNILIPLIKRKQNERE